MYPKSIPFQYISSSSSTLQQLSPFSYPLRILNLYLPYIYHNSINQFESLCTKFSYQSISKFQRILSLSLSTTKREESTYRSHARILSLVKHLDYAFHPFRTYLHPPLPVPPGTLVKRLETIPFTRIVINPWRGYRLFSLPRLP